MEFLIPSENVQPNHCQEKICLSYTKIAWLFSPGKAVTCWPPIFPFSLFYWYKQPQRSITIVPCHHTPIPGVRLLQSSRQRFGSLPGVCRSGLSLCSWHMLMARHRPRCCSKQRGRTRSSSLLVGKVWIDPGALQFQWEDGAGPERH